MNNHGKDKLAWDEEIWNRIDQAVHDEAQRTKVVAKFLPLYVTAPGDMTVPAELIVPAARKQQLVIDESATVSIVELLVEFALTSQQYEREKDLMTAVTLATRATNLLSQAEDLVLFQGNLALDDALFKNERVRKSSGAAGKGLLLLDSPPTDQVIPVPVSAIVDRQPKWGEKTFGAVAAGYARLQDKGHYGPYALVLHTVPYADTYAALAKESLVITADRIKPLVTAGFFGTGTVPDLTGVLVSIGGNTMDLAVGIDATTEFLQNDAGGQYLFRVYERFALRLKDTSAVIRLEFQEALKKVG